jgi:hypothetical protein
MPDVEMTKLTPSEKSRVYTFSSGEKVTLENVTEFCARPSGTHRLRTADGRLHIVPPTWLHIEIDAGDWTV